jgi:ParB-like chromosome segregation protein Spo0J
MALNMGTLAVLRMEDIVIDLESRGRKAYGVLGDLVQSIKIHGLIHPIAVYSPKLEAPYKLVAGGRRYMACVQLKWEEIPCRIYDTEMTEKELMAVELFENLHRMALSHTEEVQMKERLHITLQEIAGGPKISKTPGAPGHSLRDTAKILGQSPATLSQDLKLAELDRQFPELKLSEAKNKSAAMKQANRFLDVMNNKLSVREARKSAAVSKRMTTPDNPLGAYIVGDFFDNSLEPGQFSLIECDPPYGIDLQTARAEASENPSLQFDYQEISGPEYLMFLNKLMDECYRLAAESAFVILWVGPEHLNRAVSAMERAKFNVCKIPGIWKKGNSQGQAQGMDVYLGNSYEMFVYGYKGSPKVHKRGRSNIFDFSGVPGSKRIHPTERPEALMAELLDTFASPGANVLVPFAGSGVTLVTAFGMRMKAIGFDLSQHFYEGYIARLLSLEEVGAK